MISQLAILRESETGGHLAAAVVDGAVRDPTAGLCLGPYGGPGAGE